MKKMGRALKIIALILLILLGVNAVGERVFSRDDAYSSKYIYVIDRESQSIMLEKNAKEKAYPASLTKMMTTLVALEKIDDLAAIAPIDVDTYKEMVAQGSSMAGFYGRETTTYRDLLYGTMLSSGGEAANSLAINLAGDIDTFVKLMNQKADEIGLKDTHFTNPEGLHNSKQVTTAYDMALLVDYALQNNDFRAIMTRRYFTTSSTLDHPEGIVLESTVLSKVPHHEITDFEIIGGKSGRTYEAGNCWAVVGTKDGKEYISIVMGAGLDDSTTQTDGHISDTLNIFAEMN